MKVTVSSNRKLSHQAYGGIQYETSDIYVGYEAEVEPANLEEMTRKLRDTAERELAQAVSAKINSIRK